MNRWPATKLSWDYFGLVFFSYVLATQEWFPAFALPFEVAAGVFAAFVLYATFATNAAVAGRGDWAVEFAQAVQNMHQMCYNFADSQNDEAKDVCVQKLLHAQEVSAEDEGTMEWLSMVAPGFRRKAAYSAIFGATANALFAAFSYYLELSWILAAVFLASALLRFALNANLRYIEGQMRIVDAVFSDEGVKDI